MPACSMLAALATASALLAPVDAGRSFSSTMRHERKHKPRSLASFRKRIMTSKVSVAAVRKPLLRLRVKQRSSTPPATYFQREPLAALNRKQERMCYSEYSFRLCENLQLQRSARHLNQAPLLHTVAQRIRRLQNVEDTAVATVTTPEQFEAALVAGTELIVIEEHLDFSTYATSTQLNWTAAFHVPEGIKTIHGNCLSPLPPEADLGIDDTAALLLPQKDGQCLITFSDALLAIQSTSGDMLLMDNLYFRDTRPVAENKIVVVLASGRKYDSSPVDTGKGLFLSRVTVQGTGYAAIRGLYTTGWVYAEECIFSNLGVMEGLPPVKVRFQGATAAFKGCTFQENTSPNDFGPILAEDNAAVKLEECTFKNNTPDLLDAFSGGKFFSDEKRTVWNNPTATFITTGTIAQSEISRSTFLDASDPFLAEQEEGLSGGRPQAKLEITAELSDADATVAPAPEVSAPADADGDDVDGNDDDDETQPEDHGQPRRERRARQVQSFPAGGRVLL